LTCVYTTGVAELTGALGLVLPLMAYRRLGVPHVRQWVGIGLAILFALLVMANINVALKGSHVQGLAFGAWYYWSWPLLQPLFILWALYVSGVIGGRSHTDSSPVQLV